MTPDPRPPAPAPVVGRAFAGLLKKAEPVTVKIAEAPRGRVTGWSVECSEPEHGAMPVLAPGRPNAIHAATAHIEHEHGKRGRVVHRGRIVATVGDRGKPLTAGYEDADRRTRRAVGLR